VHADGLPVTRFANDSARFGVTRSSNRCAIREHEDSHCVMAYSCRQY